MQLLAAAALLALVGFAGGCHGTALVRAVPPDADLTVDGTPLRQNWFEYGRWIGNEYRIAASAPGYRPATTTADVHLGTRCGLIVFYSLVSVFGAPVALTCPWQGEIHDTVIELEKDVRADAVSAVDAAR